jgi:transposase-like protein
MTTDRTLLHHVTGHHRRTTPRVHTDEEKAEFFRLLAEQGNASAVARQIGFVRVTCYIWVDQAGIFTGLNVDKKRDVCLELRAEGLGRAEAAEQAGVDRRTAQDFDKGIRQLDGGRSYAHETVFFLHEQRKGRGREASKDDLLDRA